MHKKLSLLLFLGVAGVLTMGQSQCRIDFPDPLLDTTGTYEGTWWGSTTDGAQQVQQSPLRITLTQDTSQPYPKDHAVTGTVNIDFSGLNLPEWASQPAPSVVNVSGLLGDDGKLTLLSGGCTTALCLVLSLSGPAEDTDGDGLMDAYSGDWAFAILLAGVQPFGVTGGFNVARTAPTP